MAQQETERLALLEHRVNSLTTLFWNLMVELRALNDTMIETRVTRAEDLIKAKGQLVEARYMVDQLRGGGLQLPEPVVAATLQAIKEVLSQTD